MPEESGNALKIRENLLRRMAARQGVALRKSRRRDPNARDYGAYLLVDADSGVGVNGDLRRGGLSLEEVSEALTRPRGRRASL